MSLPDMSFSSFLSFLYIGFTDVGWCFVLLFSFLKKISSGLLTPFFPISFLCLLFLGGDLELGAGVLVLFSDAFVVIII